DYAKDRQSFRDVVRLKPQPRANGGGQSEERETDIIIIETSGELHARERRQAVGFENFEIRRVAEEPKRRQTIERSNEPQNNEYKPKQSASQSEATIYWREYHVKRAEQNDYADAISNEADERETKLRLVRENIARRVHGIPRNDERLEQYVIAENDEAECEQTGNACDFGRGAL